MLNTIWLDSQVLIWRHELFHASLGHSRYLLASLGLRLLREYPEPDRLLPREHYAVLRALEFHADWAAFGSVLELTQSNLDPAGGDLQKKFGISWRVASLMASIFLLPVFFRVAELRDAPKQHTHPSAAARLSIFLTRIAELKDPTARAQWLNGTQIALKALRSMAATHNDFSAFADMFSDNALDEGNAERIACIDDFEQLQDALNVYAVLPLGHPHQGSVDPLPAES